MLLMSNSNHNGNSKSGYPTGLPETTDNQWYKLPIATCSPLALLKLYDITVTCITVVKVNYNAKSYNEWFCLSLTFS